MGEMLVGFDCGIVEDGLGVVAARLWVIVDGFDGTRDIGVWFCSGTF